MIFSDIDPDLFCEFFKVKISFNMQPPHFCCGSSAGGVKVFISSLNHFCISSQYVQVSRMMMMIHVYFVCQTCRDRQEASNHVKGPSVQFCDLLNTKYLGIIRVTFCLFISKGLGNISCVCVCVCV
jgi:hypothetical protein